MNRAETVSWVFLLTVLAMVAFAWNSIFCRLALLETTIDPTSFTTIRLVSGALTLVLLIALQGQHRNLLSSLKVGNWTGAGALLGYALCFSIAYQELSSGVGALLLFGAVQCTMVGYGWKNGDRLSAFQAIGFGLAIVGLVYLLWPTETPETTGSTLLDLYSVMMVLAGVCWGIYTLLARSAGPPLLVTGANFLRASLLVTPVFVVALFRLSPIPINVDGEGTLYALLSGALTSAVGYAIWYRAAGQLPPTIAASVQLSVPILVPAFGWLILDETVSLRHAIAAILVLGGVGIVIALRPTAAVQQNKHASTNKTDNRS